MSKKLRIAGINFDHFHMGDLLRMVHEHPDAELAAICDEQPARMAEARRNFAIPAERIFTDVRECMEKTRPDVVILCPAAARHGEYVRLVAPFGVHVLVEKPFAASLAEADAMIAAMPKGKLLAINWPLRWEQAAVTAKRVIDEGTIGKVTEFHHYGGNRGPLYHGADKIEKEPTAADKAASWFYKKTAGGGSLLDYLGYGTTLGTWFMGGRKPIEVTAAVDDPKGLEVDEHSVVVIRYETGLSKCETRWGTFTDPWTHQPQPKCGFVICGTEGTVSSYDYESTVRIQTRAKPAGFELPCDTLRAPERNPIEYFLNCIATGTPLTGPLSPEISRIGQQIVDGAVQSAHEKRTVPLPG
jgi:glucose-fructose oxidoreductase